MRKIYQSVWIELPYPVFQITNVRMEMGKNMHTFLQITAVCEEEKWEDIVNYPVEKEKIQAGFLDHELFGIPFFVGRILSATTNYDKGQLTLELLAVSMTYSWNIVRRKRSFQNLDATYDEIIKQVLSAYPGASWISCADTQKKVPGLLLQYDETDWEFLCRLATHFETFLIEEPAGEYGQIYFGMPSFDFGKQMDAQAYHIMQNMAKYQSYTKNVAPEMMLQDNLSWQVVSRQACKLGENVWWKQVSCQITSIIMEVHESELWYLYGLERTKGVKSYYSGNPRISGLSLPAVIKERNGNRLRVQFSIDSAYLPGNNVYFTYAIETTSWYCLPEVGSLVHIYFPNWDETSGIAVHAMRLGGKATSKSVSAKGAVGDKSFSTSDGKAMELMDKKISFVSDEEKLASFTLSSDGSLNMDAVNIALSSDANLRLGSGSVYVGKEVMEVIPEHTIVQSTTGVVGIGIAAFGEEEVTLAEDKGIMLSESDAIYLIASSVLTYDAKQKDPPGIQYSDTELRKEDKSQRETHNAEVFEVREKEAKGKSGVGGIVAGIGLVVSGAGVLALAGVVTVCTGGTALMLGAGATAYLCGTAQIDEGLRDMSKMESGDFSESYNLVRDGMCGKFDNKQAVYNTVMYGSVMIGLGVTLSPLAGEIPAASKEVGLLAGQMLTAGGLSSGVMYLQDVTDGYVDWAWTDYLANFAVSSATAGIGFMAASQLAWFGQNSVQVQLALRNAGNFAPMLIIGAETVVDVGADYVASRMFNQKFDLTMSLLTSLASNIAFSIDPVDMATGGFCLTATDLSLPDLIDESFSLQRIYNSVVPCVGGLGKNWMLGLESRLFIRKEEGCIDAICVDGHAERFSFEDGIWKNRRQGDCRYQLKELPEEKGFVLLYIPEFRQYDYDEGGRLLSIRGHGKTQLTVYYEKSHIRQVVTSAGFVLDFQYEGNLIAEIQDEMGRKIRYKYDEGRLKAVCHVDEGVTTYHYDDKGYISQVIDQNGHAYVQNEYDNQGRVINQYYLDGTKSALTYDLKQRENTVYIEALNRTERYRYNQDSLVTHTYFDDGSLEEVRYDVWSNRIYEKDRNGNETYRQYNACGQLLKEILPSGQSWECIYDDNGNLLKKFANTGQEVRYTYDSFGFLSEESEKIEEGHWKYHQYERDAYGRIIKETDSLGNTTVYTYDDRIHHLPQASSEENAVGERTVYTYDSAGRRISISNPCQTTELRYNRQDYLTYVKDGNGNEIRRTYDHMGNMTAYLPPNQGADGAAWMYCYDFFDRMIEARDPLGNSWKQERDIAGNVLSKTTPEGHITRYEYDSDSHKLRTIYPDGSIERNFYDCKGNLVKKVRPAYYNKESDDGMGSVYTYDSMDRLLQITDEEGYRIVKNTYDKAGNLVEEQNGEGTTIYHTYDLTGNRTTTWSPLEENEEGEVLYRIVQYVYDTEGNKILERRGLDKVRLWEISSCFLELQFSYDALNRLILVSDGSGARAAYHYDSQGNRTEETFKISDEVEQVIHYQYDAVGNLIEKKEGIEERFLKPSGQKRKVWAKTCYRYDKNGNCVESISPKGYRRTWAYDALDQVITQEELDTENGIHRKFSYFYDSDGDVLCQTNKSLPEETSRRFTYDSKGRLTHFTDECGAITRLFYDANDRIIKLVQPEQYNSARDDGNGISYVYDCRDNILQVIGPDGELLQENTYNLSGTIKTEETGGVIFNGYEYDLTGNPTAFYQGKNNAQKGISAQRLVYDPWGNVTKAIDGEQNITEFVLDAWGRITEIHTPEGGTERYTYDYAGNITSTTDANGGTITYCYNSMGQVYEVIDQEGNGEFLYCDEEGRRQMHIDRNGNVERYHYTIDGNVSYQRSEDKKGRYPVVNRYMYYPDGRLKEADGGGITYHYDYTENGFLKRKSTAKKSLLEYVYDKNGNLSILTDGKGESLYYSYDGLNRLHQVNEGEGKEAILAQYSYNPAGQIQKLYYGNGLQTQYSYRDDGNLSSLVTITAQGKVLLNFDYAYDKNGNCTQKRGERYQNTYIYDRMHRLVEASYDGKSERYTYDLAGNRLKKESEQGIETYHYNVKNQLIHVYNKDGGIQYHYDYQGNLLEEKANCWKKQYTYDAANRQRCVVIENLDNNIKNLFQQNQYDAEGLRYEVKENEKSYYFLFDRGELAEENQEDNNIRYLRGYQPIALENSRDKGYFVQDEAGSTLFILDKDHEIQKTYRYDAFGVILKETGSNGELFNRLTYTGQMFDGATGQYYLRARFYHPEIGRFMQEDMYRGDGLNLYAYCANNPVMYYDPSGYVGICPRRKMHPGKKKSNKGTFFEQMDYDEAIRYEEYWYNANAKKYAELVNSNKTWLWDDINGGNFTSVDKKIIKQRAIAQKLIPDVSYKPGTRYADFNGAKLVKRTETVPQSLWKSSDSVQFNYLNKKIGGRIVGTTWHHTEMPGQMELVPFGIHNVFNHQGGRSKGHWAYRPEGR